MTTVVVSFKDGKVYADTQTTNLQQACDNTMLDKVLGSITYGVETVYELATTKIHKVEDKLIFSAVGNCEIIDKCYMAIAGNDPLPSPTKEDHLNTVIIIVTRTGETTTLKTYESCYDATPWWSKQRYTWKRSIVKKQEGYETFGSGKMYAMGALMSGSNPEESIVAASKVCVYTNAIVQSEGF